MSASAVAFEDHSSLKCASCGTLQTVDGGPHVVAWCRTCGTLLVHRRGRSIDLALACSAATAILLVPANLLPFLRTDVLGLTIETRLYSSVAVLWRQGWPWLAAVVAAFVVVLPLVRFVLLTAVLQATRRGARGRGLERAFGLAQSLAPWAMSDVFVLALWIAYGRLAGIMTVTIGPGAVCLVAAGVLTLATRAALPEEEVGRRIAPLGRAARPAVDGPTPEIGRARLRQSAAFAIAGATLYVLANVYPMATIPHGLRPHHYTVLEGIRDLFSAHLYALALLVLTVSFLIPLLKLFGLGWCISSSLRGSRRRLRTKTRLYWAVEEIGRWSMTDPFVIACFVPTVQFSSLLYGRAEAGASIFTFVVVSTMVAALRFDPRSLWHADRG